MIHQEKDVDSLPTRRKEIIGKNIFCAVKVAYNTKHIELMYQSMLENASGAKRQMLISLEQINHNKCV
uniref:Uncharacterized protein n=1 Tax=Arundo donax TaxID=35708 RepID=A0A0A9CLX6_ARUDO